MTYGVWTRELKLSPFDGCAIVLFQPMEARQSRQSDIPTVRIGAREASPDHDRQVGIAACNLRPGRLEIIADFSDEEIVYFTVPWNRGRSARLAIHVHRVVASLMQELAPVVFQMPDPIDPFHAAGRISVSRMTSAPSTDCADKARFASRTIATASFRFARAPSRVSP